MAGRSFGIADSLIGWGIYVVGLLPAAIYFWLGATGGLGADPVREFEQTLGLWALRFLILTLAVTPLRELAGVNLLRYRRALGLLAFWYAVMHFTVYLTLDRGLLWGTILPDIAKRPFITLGFSALVLLVPLALTSNRLSIRRLGRNWRRLHRLIYVAAALAAVHYLMATKVVDPTQAAHVGLIVLLLAYRLVRPLMPRRRTV
ncbi:protein-methionine-sulfoxide reductase heme-binding subunit MsrQ [Pleomorphomonas koreensis]|uniref:protein-methionine-sulfoxide reductase heme-binding subunit MsrQ n=1 Tax=Pleomorphomonas koreensis TaxID=257440 RepID=UPI000424BBC9|nr:protein-methionine-sulfoxide reductase heme-binding subunit MsrQ [Pleomorphomonas koreensis]